jgi:hypothetical protein
LASDLSPDEIGQSTVARNTLMGPANPKIPTGLGNVAYLLGVPESPKLALNIAVDLAHRSLH